MNKTANWTVMVYMAADTGESFYQNAMENITEMIAADFDPDKIKVLVYADAPSPWPATRWEVEGTTKAVRGRATGREVRKTTLLQFVKTSTIKHPAEYYLLVLWGHGEGIDWKQKVLGGEPGVKRFGQGSQSALEIGELGKILDEMFGQRYFDRERVVVGFDACLMGMVEVYYEIRKYVGRVVAPDDEIPDTGWPYKEILSKLKSNTKPADLAKTIVEQCPLWYSQKSHESNVSFSACDLAEDRCVRLKNAVIKLREKLTKQVDTERGLKAIREARDFAEDYRERAYVDLNAFCSELDRVADRHDSLADLKNPAREVIDALGDPPRISSKFVIATDFSDEYPYKYERDSRAVSICFPESEDLEGSIPGIQIDWGRYLELKFTKETGWDEFVVKFWNRPRLD